MNYTLHSFGMTVITLSFYGIRKLARMRTLFLSSLIIYFFLPWGGKIADLAQQYNPSLSVREACQIEESICFWTEERNINLYSFLAIIVQESEFNPNAIGTNGERGLGQITRICLTELNSIYGTKFSFDKLFKIDHNIEVATLHYRYSVERANFQRREAIARYRTPSRPEDSNYYARKILKIRAEIEKRLAK